MINAALTSADKPICTRTGSCLASTPGRLDARTAADQGHPAAGADEFLPAQIAVLARSGLKEPLLMCREISLCDGGPGAHPGRAEEQYYLTVFESAIMFLATEASIDSA